MNQEDNAVGTASALRVTGWPRGGVVQTCTGAHRRLFPREHYDRSLTYLLTELSPSWGAVNCAAHQELPSILWNPKVQYRVHKSPPLVPILSHINPIHSITSYLSKIHFNIVHTYWSSQWSLSFWLSHQYPMCIPLLPHSCYMPRPSHPSWLE
jgi:hypothetical protein